MSSEAPEPTVAMPEFIWAGFTGWTFAEMAYPNHAARYRLASSVEREIAERDAEIAALKDALRDMLSGWRYIRQIHGDLYGVGWDRAQQKAEAALGQTVEQSRE